MRLIAILVLLGSVVVLHSAEAQEPSASDRNAARIAEGHKQSIRLCSTCHIVAADQPYPPILTRVTPPFFFEMANNPKTTPESLDSHLKAAHWDFKSQPMTMPDQELDDERKRDIIAYIMSLRRK